MKPFSVLFVLGALFCLPSLSAQEPEKVLPPLESPPLEAGTIISTNLPAVDAPEGVTVPFNMNETLTFRVYWGRLYVAEAISDTRWVDVDGRKLIAIRMRTKSKSLLDALYPVDDFIETIVDPTTMRPLRFIKNLNEGKYRCRELSIFDWTTGKAHWVSTNKRRVKTYDIKPDTRDLATFMYWLRTQEFEPEKKYTFGVMADERHYDLEIGSGKVEPVKLGLYGKTESIRLYPEAEFEGLFVRKGKMDVWITNDDRRVLSRMDVEVPLASVHIYLHKIDGGPKDRYNKEIDLDAELSN